MKILHLPTEIAGQISLTAQAQRLLGFESLSLSHPHRFNYPVDIIRPLSSNRWSNRRERINTFLRTAEAFDVYHYHFATTILPGMIDARYEKWRSKRVVTEFWGSEVRLPEIEAERNPYYVNSYNESEAVNRKRLQEWAELTEGEVIFSDHSFNVFFESYFDKIHVIGQRVDCAQYFPHYPDADTKNVLVLHAPSEQAFKGTIHVERAVEKLKRKGLKFDYVRVTDLSNKEAVNLYKSADIIIDQLCGGSHGVFACEAMALGKPVVCYILPELVPEYPEGFPIINANPDTIESVLEEWIQVPVRRHELGKQSRAYAEKFHDAQTIAENLIRIYKKDFNQTQKGTIDWRKGSVMGLT